MAQQKKTDAVVVADLDDLTDQQFAFVKGLLEGKSGSDAYRAAYSCENSKPETIWASASRLRHDPKVAQWLAAARMANLDQAKVTLNGHLAELARLREIGIESGNVGAAVNAEGLRGKAQGLYVERIEDARSANDHTLTLEQLKECLVTLPSDVRAELAKALMGDSPKPITSATVTPVYDGREFS